MQSLVWTLVGIVLSFLLAQKTFGSLHALLGTILVLSQSDLLLSQAQEARHYSMFFACAAWVLLMQSCKNEHSKKQLLLTFLAHFCLCQTHYLGIVFSGLAGLSYLVTNRVKSLIYKIPISVLLAWFISIPIYLLLLSKQSSHLGNWPKPNGLSNLLATYNDSLIFISIIIPIAGFLMVRSSSDKNRPASKDTKTKNETILTTASLWLVAPILFWIISHLTSLNLFVDRYFIPKEAAIIFLVAYGFNFILQKLPQQKSKNIPMFSTLALSVILLLISTKRAAFGLNKDTNYHHSLIIKESYLKSEQPIILEGDPKYFPNAYLGINECLFAMENESLMGVYQRFSSKIKILKK